MLLPQWAYDKAQGMSTSEAQGLLESSRRLSGAIRDAAGRIRMGLADSKVSNKHKLALTAALVYVVCFWDVIPDFGPLGWVDDLAVVQAALRMAFSGQEAKAD